MKKLILVLVLFFVASVSFAQSAGTPVKVQLPDGSFTYSKADASGSLIISGGSGTGISTFTMVMPDPVVTQDKVGRVTGVNFYKTWLATDSVTKLSQICSYTVPVLIQLDHQGQQYFGPASETAANIRLLQMFPSGTKWTITPATDTFDVGFTSNTTASSALVITIWNLAQ